jgi:hypothetical protein
VSSGERFWFNRLRWRLRGALQWPAFVLFTLLDGLVIHWLPPSAFDDPDVAFGIIISTFANLFLLGVAAPFLARRLGARRAQATAAPAGAPVEPLPEVEREVLQDRVAAALLAVGVAATVVSGLANRPFIVSETDAKADNARAVRQFVIQSDDKELQRNLETANTIRPAEGYFRTCIARDDRRHFVCVFVDTKKDPPKLSRDPDGRPNPVAFPGERN